MIALGLPVILHTGARPGAPYLRHCRTQRSANTARPAVVWTASYGQPNSSARLRRFAHRVSPAAQGRFVTAATVSPSRFLLQTGGQMRRCMCPFRGGDIRWNCSSVASMRCAVDFPSSLLAAVGIRAAHVGDVVRTERGRRPKADLGADALAIRGTTMLRQRQSPKSSPEERRHPRPRARHTGR